MAARTIEGPSDDWLDMADLTRLTALSESTIRRLIDAGEFPRALEVTPGVRMWHWRDVVYWTLRVELRPRLTPEGPAEAEKSPASGRGHRPPQGGQGPPSE